MAEHEWHEREPPLRPDELRVLRGMIDNRLYELERNRRWSTRFGDARTVLIVVFAFMSLVIQGAGAWLH
jgi:hypothetical protein